MFSYEENEKSLKNAIMKCLNERFESWETNDDWIRDCVDTVIGELRKMNISVDTVIGELRKMNIFQRDVEERIAAIFIEDKLFSSDEYIGNDVEKALTFIRNNIDELKEELRIHRNYSKTIDKYPNADWIE